MHLLSERGSTSLSEFGSLVTLLVYTLGQQLGVLVCGVLGGFGTSSLECDSVSLVLQALRGDQSLDLRGLGVGFRTFLLGDNLTSDNEFAVRQC